ncbi:MAG: 2-phospho-L-lactate guanylyltransferase [Verrucomicrobiota bacterium]
MGLLFEVVQQEAGGYEATCLSEFIRTGGADLAELHANINNAVDNCFEAHSRPPASEIHLMFTTA